MLATAAQIVLARVDELEPVAVDLAPARPGRGAYTRRFTEIRFRTMADVRGGIRARHFHLRHREHTPGMCDFRGDPETLDGLEVGDLVLIFAGPGDLDQETFLEAIPQGAALAPATQALFNPLRAEG